MPGRCNLRTRTVPVLSLFTLKSLVIIPCYFPPACYTTAGSLPPGRQRQRLHQSSTTSFRSRAASTAPRLTENLLNLWIISYHRSSRGPDRVSVEATFMHSWPRSYTMHVMILKASCSLHDAPKWSVFWSLDVGDHSEDVLQEAPIPPGGVACGRWVVTCPVVQWPTVAPAVTKPDLLTASTLGRHKKLVSSARQRFPWWGSSSLPWQEDVAQATRTSNWSISKSYYS